LILLIFFELKYIALELLVNLLIHNPDSTQFNEVDNSIFNPISHSFAVIDQKNSKYVKNNFVSINKIIS
jgi:hypothetical protein